MATIPQQTPLNQLTVQRLVAAMQSENFGLASELANEELARGCVHPLLYNARAKWHELQQRDRDALDDYTRSHWLEPNNILTLNALGLCQLRLQQFDEAVATFDKAIATDPRYVPSYNRKGMVLQSAGNPAGARKAYEQALAVYPRNAQALASLATMAAQRGDMAEAQERGEQALKIAPGEPTAQVALALVDLSKKDFAAAERRVRPLLAANTIMGNGRAALYGILGDALDGQKKPDEAFAAYSEENAERLRLTAPFFAGRMTIANLSDGMRRFFESSDVPWQATRPGTHASKPVSHVFLVGFYRSGTTLLEQVLETNPDVTTLEERDLLDEAAEQYLPSSNGLKRLAALEGDALEEERKNYWARVDREGLNVAGKVFVDKHPLNTVKLPIIAKLFPDAKIIFAIRDPRDVVLSCFRRHFQINAAMYEMLTLPGAARAYDAVMELATTLRPKLGLSVLEHRYEDLVTDFEKSVRAVCEFIGVPYTAAMADFHSVRRKQEIISPSAAQVRQELYRDSVDHWRLYTAQLEPVRPLLDRWAKHFGYPLE